MNYLDTQRLILRAPAEEDANQIFQNWASDAKTNRYVSWNAHKDVDDTLEYINTCLTDIHDGGYHWIVELKSTHELIGDISIIHISQNHSNCEVGYCYGSKYWGNGYATEALRCVLEFMLNDVGVHLVEAKYYSNNPASGKVMKKSGMRYDATLRERRIDKITEEIIDLVVYSITKADL